MIRLFAFLPTLLAIWVCLPCHAQRPLTGPAVPGYEALEKAMNDFMDLIQCQAGTVAVSKETRLLYSRGFGWTDAQRSKPTPPDALMRIASVTKPITAAAVKNAIREKQLSLDTKAFEFIAMKSRNGKVADPRIFKITVRHLLEHKGGWDRGQAFDPMFATRAAERELGLSQPATPANIIEYMLARPLQFEPGEKSVYSNFGYCVLGRVLEKAMKMPYAQCIQNSVCGPLHIADIKLGRTSERDPREVDYPVANNAFSLDVMDAHGGLIASAPAVCRFLDYYWINGEPRKAGQSGDWTFFGSLPGTTSLARQRTDGLNVVVLLNGRREQWDKDNGVLRKNVDAALDRH